MPYAFTAATPHAYPEFGITAEVGDVVDFGLMAMPTDGWWQPAAADAVPTKTVGTAAPVSELPVPPSAVLAWDPTLEQYVPLDSSTTTIREEIS